jgi:hypothetical protein
VEKCRKEKVRPHVVLMLSEKSSQGIEEGAAVVETHGSGGIRGIRIHRSWTLDRSRRGAPALLKPCVNYLGEDSSAVE